MPGQHRSVLSHSVLELHVSQECAEHNGPSLGVHIQSRDPEMICHVARDNGGPVTDAIRAAEELKTFATRECRLVVLHKRKL